MTSTKNKDEVIAQELEKKTILILDLRAGGQSGKIVKDLLAKSPSFDVISIAYEHFASGAEQVVDEVLDKFLILKKAKSTISTAVKTALDSIPLPKLERAPSFYKRLPLHNKIKNAILRYHPDIVLCLSPEVLKVACAYKAHSKGEFRVGALLDSYYPDKRYASREADFIIVDNYDIKQQFIAYGLKQDAIAILPIPVQPVVGAQPTREEALKHFELDDKPVLFIHTTSLGDERFKKVITEIGMGERINMLVSVGQNKRMARYIEELYKPWIRVIAEEDIPLAISLSDAVISRPQPSLLATLIYMEKLTFSIFAQGVEEKHTEEYLGFDTIVACKDIAELKDNIKRLIEDREAFSENFHFMRAANAERESESLINILLDDANENTTTTETDES